MASYKVQFLRNGEEHVLRFDVEQNFLQLDDEVVQQAIDRLLPESARPAYQEILDLEGPLLLKPEYEYAWRVRGISLGLEPTPWSEWQTLKSGCQIVNFSAVDGYNQAPTIEWTTSSCEGYSVHVLASTPENLPEQGCKLHDGLFSGLKNGPRPAHFMVHGYDYDDVLAAQSLTTPIGYNINLNGTHDCPPLEEASFRIEIVDPSNGNQVVDQSETVTVQARLDPNGCRIQGFYLNHGYDGQPPVVTWSTVDCQGNTVVVSGSTVPGTVPAACVFQDRELWRGASGTEAARIMVEGWTSAVNGQPCEPVSELDFSLAVYAGPEATGSPLLSRLPIRGAVDPSDSGECFIRFFDSYSSGPGELPVITWETRNCEDSSIEILASTILGGYEQGCRLRERPVEVRLPPVGSMPADFMSRGYEVDGNLCGTISAAEVWLQAGGRESFHLPVVYTGSAMPDLCRIIDFSIMNRPNDAPPILEWTSDCAGVGDRRVDVVTSTLGWRPPGCGLQDAPWESLPSGRRQADFMAGWDDCPPVDKARFEARIVNPQTGEVTNTPPQLFGYYSGGTEPFRDLTAESTVSDPVEARAGDTLSLTYKIRNLGGAEVSPGFLSRFYLSANAWLDPTDPELGSSVPTGSPVSGGGVFLATTGTLVLPTGIAPGTYYVNVQVDSEDIVLETNERNNVVEIARIEILPQTCLATPSFMGLSAAAVDLTTCGVQLGWPAGASACGNPLVYNVYRGSHPSVAATEYYLLSEAVAGTTYLDQEAAIGATYYYLATAVDTVTGLESGVGFGKRSVTVLCPSGSGSGNASGGTFSVSPGGNPAQPVAPSTPVALSWSFPTAVSVFLVGFDYQELVGDLIISPTATTTYELHVDFGSGLSSYLSTVYVQGGVAPQRLGACDQPCSAGVLIDGNLHYCRGVTNPANELHLGESMEISPRWIMISDWASMVGENGAPRSPYCFRATCGAGDVPPYHWKAPQDIPENWISDDYLQLWYLEIVGDGLDNDCDGEIDETW